MSILVQREFQVATGDVAEFERQSREGLWPAFLRFGAFMVAYGRWAFGGPGDVVVTHTVYADFPHWEATRMGGPCYQDPGLRAEVADLLPIYQQRNRLVRSSRARLVELYDDGPPGAAPRRRQAGEPIPDAPPSFGRGSVVSERTYSLTAGGTSEFLRLSREQIWPWLEAEGGRLVALGVDPMEPSDEVVTLFAFPSLAEWHRVSRPTTDLQPPAHVEDAWQQRHRLVQSQRGRLLQVGTDFGAG